MILESEATGDVSYGAVILSNWVIYYFISVKLYFYGTKSGKPVFR